MPIRKQYLEYQIGDYEVTVYTKCGVTAKRDCCVCAEELFIYTAIENKSIYKNYIKWMCRVCTKSHHLDDKKVINRKKGIALMKIKGYLDK